MQKIDESIHYYQRKNKIGFNGKDIKGTSSLKVKTEP